MKGTETLIQNKFLKLLNKYKIDEIDVNMLCEAINIKRQTFYYHYKNIYDVICSIFYSKRLEVKNPRVLNKIIEEYLDLLFDDEQFHREINESNAKDALLEYSISFIYKALLIYLDKFKLRGDFKKDVARFVSVSLVNQALFYFLQHDLSKHEIYSKVSAFINEEIVIKMIYNYNKLNF